MIDFLKTLTVLTLILGYMAFGCASFVLMGMAVSSGSLMLLLASVALFVAAAASIHFALKS